MSDDVSDIASFYDATVEDEDKRLAEHQLEYDLTLRLLARHLPNQGTLLEIGAGTGKYTIELAKLGYSITAVDLSPALLARCENRVAGEQLQSRVQCVVADARDLSPVTRTDFDAVLIMGPLYHLVLEEDRKQALRECINRLRPGGVVFSTFLSRLGVLGDFMRRMPDWIERRDEVGWFIEHGKRPDHQPRGGFRGYFAQVSEVAPLHEELGIETLVLAGLEPAISAHDESYNNLAGVRRELWLNLLLEVCTQEAIIGASRHLMYVGRKG